MQSIAWWRAGEEATHSREVVVLQSFGSDFMEPRSWKSTVWSLELELGALEVAVRSIVIPNQGVEYIV